MSDLPVREKDAHSATRLNEARLVNFELTVRNYGLRRGHAPQ
jgi:hypothetical protein